MHLYLYSLVPFLYTLNLPYISEHITKHTRFSNCPDVSTEESEAGYRPLGDGSAIHDDDDDEDEDDEYGIELEDCNDDDEDSDRSLDGESPSIGRHLQQITKHTFNSPLLPFASS